MKNKIYIFMLLFIFIYGITFATPSKKTFIEDFEIPLGIGVDVNKNDFSGVNVTSVSTYVFEENEDTLVKIREGTGITYGTSRQNRQTKENKQYIMGQERLFIISEEAAQNGLKPYFDYLFRTSSINDKAKVIICQGKALDILKLKLPHHVNSVKFIDGLTSTMDTQNFNTEEIKVIDVYSRIGSPYRKLILPYISITKEGLEITGYALFNKDKMELKINTQESKILNLLRSGSGYGTISIIRGPNKTLDLYGKKKRKVKCTQEKDGCHFTINLDFEMEIVTNTFNNKLNSDLKVKKEAERLAEKQVEEECNDFIKKMQNYYKQDYLDLSRIVSSKYGKDADIDWNDIICNSKIDVKAKVKITKYGRGDY